MSALLVPHRLPLFLVAPLLGWPAVFALGTLALVLPSPENTALFLGAVGLGVGAGVGSGYAAFLARSTKARIAALQEWDAAQRTTTLGQLAEASRRLDAQAAQVEELTCRTAQLQADLDMEQKVTDKLRGDLMEFALRVLEAKGHIDRGPGPGPGGEAAR